MRMKKSISAVCAAAVMLSSVIGGNALFSARELHAEEVVEDGSGEGAQLSAPQNVRFEDGFIRWDKVEEAYGYILRMYMGEEDYREFTRYFDYDDPEDEAQVELDRLCYENYIDFGEYTVDVCIFDQEWNRSEWSDPITVEYAPTLDAPANVHVIDKENMTEDDDWYWCDDETILWDKVDGVYRYNIRIYNDDDDRTLYTATYTGSVAFEYRWYVYDSGDYWISVQSMDQDYNVSEWTEPILVTHVEVEEKRTATPQNLRFDESGENILWDEVEGANFYEVSFHALITEKDGNQYWTYIYDYPEKSHCDNWKSFAVPFDEAEYYIYVQAYDEEIGQWSYYSEPLNISYKPALDTSIELPKDIEVEEVITTFGVYEDDEYVEYDEKSYYLTWDTVENANRYWLKILVNGNLLQDYYRNIDAQNSGEYVSLDIGGPLPAGSYEAELYVVDQNNNYNKKTYTFTLDTEHHDNIWVPKAFYKFNDILWDYDQIRYNNTSYFWVRVMDTENNTVISLEKVWGDHYSGLAKLPNGKYTVEICVCEHYGRLGNWSKLLNIFKHGDGLFDEENKTTTEIAVPPEIEETIPEEERITSITINPAFNMKHKDGDDVEIDLSKISIKAEEIYDEEGLKRVEEALGHEIKPNQKYNLLDLTLLYDGEDFSNGYEGLVQVIIPIPSGHRDKTFTVYRLTEVDGQIVKEVIPGEQTEDSYIIYLEHFSEYALFGEGEHIHDFAEEWITDEINHWKECECGEKSEEAEHIYGDWTVTKEATETEEGTQERACEVCGYAQMESIDVLPHTHKYSEAWEKDETNHWQICEGCGEKFEEAEHIYGDWTVTKEATEAEEGAKERACEICGYKQTEAIPTLPHTHIFGENWNTDETSHWKECECGEKTEENAHNYGDWTVTKEATEAEEGAKERACEICGYKQTKVLPKIAPATNPPETDKPDEIKDNTDNTDKPKPETPHNVNPPTGVAAIEASAAVLAVCGAAVVLTAKKRKIK